VEGCIELEGVDRCMLTQARLAPAACTYSAGFLKAGGFTGVYRGLSAAAVGSAPGAAVFFSSYETLKADA
jgi:Mitochondrial carrier protein